MCRRDFISDYKVRLSSMEVDMKMVGIMSQHNVSNNVIERNQELVLIPLYQVVHHFNHRVQRLTLRLLCLLHCV